jgi:hypothetical protein
VACVTVEGLAPKQLEAGSAVKRLVASWAVGRVRMSRECVAAV